MSPSFVKWIRVGKELQYSAKRSQTQVTQKPAVTEMLLLQPLLLRCPLYSQVEATLGGLFTFYVTLSFFLQVWLWMDPRGHKHDWQPPQKFSVCYNAINGKQLFRTVSEAVTRKWAMEMFCTIQGMISVAKLLVLNGWVYYIYSKSK